MPVVRAKLDSILRPVLAYIETHCRKIRASEASAERAGVARNRHFLISLPGRVAVAAGDRGGLLPRAEGILEEGNSALRNST